MEGGTPKMGVPASKDSLQYPVMGKGAPRSKNLNQTKCLICASGLSARLESSVCLQPRAEKAWDIVKQESHTLERNTVASLA